LLTNTTPLEKTAKCQERKSKRTTNKAASFYCRMKVIKSKILCLLTTLLRRSLHPVAQSIVTVLDSESGNLSTISTSSTSTSTSTSSSLTSSSTSVNTGSHRDLATLAQKWNITGPTFGSQQLEFQLNYTVSDFIIEDMIQHQLYDSKCSEGENPLLPSTLATQVHVDMSTPVGNGDRTRPIQFIITVDPETISTSSHK